MYERSVHTVGMQNLIYIYMAALLYVKHHTLQLNQGSSHFTSAVLAEWKPPVYDNAKGIILVTATTRRNSPNVRSWLTYDIAVSADFI